MSAASHASPIPPGLVSLPDYEAHARQVLDPASWAYLNGGAADEITARANRDAWEALPLWPRVLRPMTGGHTRVELLGRTLAHPLLLAPVAYQQLAHPQGELASAHAAAAQEAGYVLSTQASMRLETVAEAFRADAQRGPLWFQLYFQPERGATLDLVRRSEGAGFEALVLSIDAPVHGARDAQRRAGFRLPAGIAAVNLPPAPAPLQGASVFEALAKAPTWADVEWLRSQTHLPIVLKGVLHPDDAREAQRLGAAALIVSNHGGRTLDTAVPTATALPQIKDAVGDLPLLVDGGIRRGTDVLKAVALGARAVLIGRPVAWGLATAGAFGMAHVLRLLRDELEIAMALTGCATLSQASPRLFEGN